MMSTLYEDLQVLRVSRAQFVKYFSKKEKKKVSRKKL
jgi:hypothetical protein